jgi:hypothetical protein
MSRLLQLSMAALWASVDLTFAFPVSAAPTHVRFVERRTPVVTARAVRAAFVPQIFAPLRYELRAAQLAPIKALPLPAPVPARMVSPLLPLGLAALAAPLTSNACETRRPTVLLATLPATPFASFACQRGDAAVRGASDAPTALVPGHNKNAFYGRAYSPHDIDAY